MTPADFLATRLEPAESGDAYAACQANPVNETGHLQSQPKKGKTSCQMKLLAIATIHQEESYFTHS
jgi:hypothetical protein